MKIVFFSRLTCESVLNELLDLGTSMNVIVCAHNYVYTTFPNKNVC